MGDRCYLHAGVRPEDVEKFVEIVGGVEQPDWDDCGLFKTVIDEQSDGAGEELMQAADEGLVFYGHHGAGGEYPAAKFASDGSRLYMLPCIYTNGSLDPVVTIGEARGELDPGDLADARACIAAFARVREMAFPTKEPEDFGEKVARLINHGLNDEEVFEFLGPDSGEMLVGLVRVLLRKMDPEA